MAIFEKKETESKEYIALLDPESQDIVAFVSPVKGIKPELMLEALIEAGLTAEIRESKSDRVELSLVKKAKK